MGSDSWCRALGGAIRVERIRSWTSAEEIAWPRKGGILADLLTPLRPGTQVSEAVKPAFAGFGPTVGRMQGRGRRPVVRAAEPRGDGPWGKGSRQSDGWASGRRQVSENAVLRPSGRIGQLPGTPFLVPCYRRPRRRMQLSGTTLPYCSWIKKPLPTREYLFIAAPERCGWRPRG